MKKQIVLASGNPGKIDEINRMLASTSIEIVPQSAFEIEEAVEDKPTFVENALIKARHAAAHCMMPAIADDSGLEVDALGGEPGVISSRYSGPDSNDEKNIKKLLGKLDRCGGRRQKLPFSVHHGVLATRTRPFTGYCPGHIGRHHSSLCTREFWIRLRPRCLAGRQRMHACGTSARGKKQKSAIGVMHFAA